MSALNTAQDPKLIDFDRCHAGLLTTARWDFSCPRMVYHSIKTKQKEWGWQCGAAAGLEENMSKHHFFRSCQNFEKIPKMFLQE
jgi:hypothetical protein